MKAQILKLRKLDFKKKKRWIDTKMFKWSHYKNDGYMQKDIITS